MPVATTAAPKSDSDGWLHEGIWRAWIGIDAVEV
jgi:hypothetical protein